MAKVLISPGYGAGWSTWSGDIPDTELLFDKQLIADIEAATNRQDKVDAAERFVHRMKQKYNDDIYIYCGGADNLEVVEVDGPFLVDEYDGHESITTAHDLWITPPQED